MMLEDVEPSGPSGQYGAQYGRRPHPKPGGAGGGGAYLPGLSEGAGTPAFSPAARSSFSAPPRGGGGGGSSGGGGSFTSSRAPPVQSFVPGPTAPQRPPPAPSGPPIRQPWQQRQQQGACTAEGRQASQCLLAFNALFKPNF